MLNGLRNVEVARWGVIFCLLLITGCGNEPPHRSHEQSDLTWTAPIVVDSGPAYRGPWKMNRSEFRYVDDPSVHVTNGGTIAVAWVNQSRKDIFLKRYRADGTVLSDTPVNVSHTPGVFSWFPDVVVDPNNPDNIYVLWQEIVFSGGSHGGEAFFTRSTNGGKSFQDPTNLSRSKSGDGKGRLDKETWDNGSLDLAVGPRGTIYAVWSEYEGPLWFTRSSDHGQSFDSPTILAGLSQDHPRLGDRVNEDPPPEPDDENPARGPSVATGPDGRLAMTWTVGDDPGADLRFLFSKNRGNSFDRSRIVNKSNGHSDAPKVAIDRQGAVHMVYAESPGKPRQGYHIKYVRSPSGQRTVLNPKIISKNQSDAYRGFHFPSLAIGPNDELYVLWEELSPYGRRPLEIGLTFSTNGGREFRQPSAVPGSRAPEDGFNGSQQGLLFEKLDVNRAGTLAVVNSQFIPNQRSRIQLILGKNRDR